MQPNLVGELAERAAALWGPRIAIRHQSLTVTFDDLAKQVDGIGRSLIALGVGRGDKVGLWMMNRPEFVSAALAVARIGAVLVPLNTRYRIDDVAYAIRQSNMSALILMDRSGPVSFIDMLGASCPSLLASSSPELSLAEFPDLRRVVVLGDHRSAATVSWDHFLEAGQRVEDGQIEARASMVSPDDLLMVVYTSGTTGSPKGVMHSHACVRNIEERARRFAIGAGDRILNYLPMFHLYAYSEGALMSVLTGAEHIIMDQFAGSAALDCVEAYGATVLHGFDTHYADLVAEQRARPRNVSSLKLATFPAGASNAAAVARTVNDVLCPTVSGFGMTEIWAFAACCATGDTLEQRCDASGKPMDGVEFRIVNPAGSTDQPPGTPGEILVRGYIVTRGYYGRPDETAAAIDADGWLHTGDMGLLRPDGHIQFLGRYKDILKVGGENVSPAEVETHIAASLDVAQVAVVGVPDDRLGEVPVAFVVARDRAAVSLDQLKAACVGRIASFKIPRHVFAVDRLPETPTGKIQKHLLREEARERLAVSADAAQRENVKARRQA